MDTKSLGEKLKSHRAKCGWNLEQCSENMKISARYLSDIERGDKVPKLETFLRILNTLHASADDVLQDSLVVGYQAQSNALLRELDTLDIARRKQALDILQYVVRAVEKSL